MGRPEMIKGKSYHDLIIQYIDQIGTSECPGGREELNSNPGHCPCEAVRTIGKVVERKGVWEIHLIRIDAARPCCFVRRPFRTFKSRKMAEIVAKYMASTQSNCCRQVSKPGRQNICWN